ncbi:MAG: hypothetical protein ABL956_02225 [Hyphomonadaceae bacterium]
MAGKLLRICASGQVIFSRLARIGTDDCCAAKISGIVKATGSFVTDLWLWTTQSAYRPPVTAPPETHEKASEKRVSPPSRNIHTPVIEEPCIAGYRRDEL